MVGPPAKIDNVLDRLEKLAALRASGALTEDDFQAVKARLLKPDLAMNATPASETRPAGDISATATAASETGPAINSATAALIAINVVVFALMALGRPSFDWDSAYLISWGADYGKLTLSGQLWRLITSTFVHLNIIHILGNMSCLYYWGSVVERGLGRRLFLGVYGLCGVAASFASVIANPQIVSAGASGAIAGVLGVMIVMWLRGDSRVTSGDVFGNLAINVFIGFAAGVDWVAHVGGLAAGLALGLVFLNDQRISIAGRSESA